MHAGQLDVISYLLLVDLFYRSVYVFVLCIPAIVVSWWLRHRLPMLQFILWALVLLRAVLPAGYAMPFSVREALVPWLPDLFGFVELRLWLVGHGWFAVASPALTEGVPWLTWHVAAVLVWTLISSIQLWRFFALRRFYRALYTAAEPVTDTTLTASIERWRARFRIRRPVVLRTGDAAVSPFTIGVFRPGVYIPRSLLEAPGSDELDAIVGHELAHVQRLDDLWILVQGLLRSLFFFLPPVHLAAAQLTRQRELLCDQLAVSRGQLSARSYGRSLLAVIRRTVPGDPHAAPAHLIGDAAFCSARIAALKDAAGTGVRGVGVSVLVFALGVLFVLPLHPHERGQAAKAERFQQRAAAGMPASAPRFRMPLEDATFGGGFRMLPPAERVSYTYHTGLDLIAPEGSPILAMAAGTVEHVVVGARDRISARTGGYVVIRHGEYLAYYTYLAHPRVSVGDTVGVGEKIGELRSPPFSPEGKSTHMHLEIMHKGRSIDPAPLLRSRS
ncbi:MAG: hypothetical protein EA417_03725 [Gammaproteobacteria bacterium]|nr:MAG: hypothetical protein EA417_03725 [Gammaproteobacteria bacterium]